MNIRHAHTPIRLLAAALLGAATALLVSCGSSGKGLIPAAQAGPLQSDFETVAQDAEAGNGDCTATESALGKTEQDFLALPAGVDKGLHAHLQVGIENLRKQALAACLQPTPTATATTPPTTSTTTHTTTQSNTGATGAETTPPATTPSATTPSGATTTPTTTTTPPPSSPSGGIEAGGEPSAEHGAGQEGNGLGQGEGKGVGKEEGGASVGGASPGGGQ